MLNSNQVIDRILQLLDIDSDSELAKRLNVSKTAVSLWRSRNRVPYEKCVELSESKLASLNWLLTGEGPMFRQQEADKPDQTPTPTEDSTTLDPKMTAVIKTVQMMPLEKQQEFIAETQKRAESIKQLIEMQERIERLEKEKCA